MTDVETRPLHHRPELGSTASYVGGYWNRTGTVEVDLVGGDRRPVADRIDFLTTFEDDGTLDVRLGPDELLAAWAG